MRKLLIAGIVTVLGVGLWFWINNKVNWKQRLLRMEYLKSGRSEQAKQVILDFWSENDSAHVSEADYLLEKTSILYAFEEYETARKIFSTVPDDKLKSAPDLFNRLQERIHADHAAALVLVRRLAATGELGLLENWVHNSFAQYFLPRHDGAKKASAYRDFLADLGDPAYPDLARITSGLRLWINAQQVADSASAVAKLAAQRFGDEGARPIRYQPLIYKILSRHSAYQKEADAMLERSIRSLESSLSSIGPVDDSRAQLEKRALLRYHLAHAYYLQAQEKLAGGDDSAAIPLLKLASDFSPDEKDRKVEHAYFYEVTVLQGEPDYEIPFSREWQSTVQAYLDAEV